MNTATLKEEGEHLMYSGTNQPCFFATCVSIRKIKNYRFSLNVGQDRNSTIYIPLLVFEIAGIPAILRTYIEMADLPEYWT